MYGDNLPPGCTIMDIERAAGGDEDEAPRGADEPGMDPETWDERDGAAADRAVSLTAMNAMRQMMGLAPLPLASA